MEKYIKKLEYLKKEQAWLENHIMRGNLEMQYFQEKGELTLNVKSIKHELFQLESEANLLAYEIKTQTYNLSKELIEVIESEQEKMVQLIKESAGIWRDLYFMKVGEKGDNADFLDLEVIMKVTKDIETILAEVVEKNVELSLLDWKVSLILGIVSIIYIKTKWK